MGGGVHIAMVIGLCACLWRWFFQNFCVSSVDFTRDEGVKVSKIIRVLSKILKKTSQFEETLDFLRFHQKWYTDGWVIETWANLEIVNPIEDFLWAKRIFMASVLYSKFRTMGSLVNNIYRRQAHKWRGSPLLLADVLILFLYHRNCS